MTRVVGCRVVLVLVLVLGWSAPPFAAAETESANFFYLRGKEAFETHQYMAAIQAYEQSHKLQPHPLTLYALAQAYSFQFREDDQLPYLRRAINLYRRFVKQAPKSPFRVVADQQLIQLLAVFTQRGGSTSQPVELPQQPTQLMISSSTDGARVTIDGVPRGGEPVPAIRPVKVGPHVVEVSAPGHRATTFELVAVKSSLVVRHVDLKPLPGKLRVSADLDGAAVYVDGDPVGQTPLNAGGFEPGGHQVAIAHRGRRLWTDNVVVESERTSVASANLLWSSQRKAAVATLGGAVATAAAALVTGLLATSEDSGLGSVPPRADADRKAWDDRLDRRNGLADASTGLFITAGAALVAAAILYWFDRPDPPIRQRQEEQRQAARVP